jgi:hypothetical protein
MVSGHLTEGSNVPRGCRIYRHHDRGAWTQFHHFGPQKARSIEVAEKIMARNFGVPRQIDRHTRTPVWRTWLVALLGVINAATFLHHRSG